ncbi:hypothetical protein Droror1_Dr00003351 [Drosera rotundifolia]
MFDTGLFDLSQEAFATIAKLLFANTDAGVISKQKHSCRWLQQWATGPSPLLVTVSGSAATGGNGSSVRVSASGQRLASLGRLCPLLPADCVFIVAADDRVKMEHA